ncbi:M24 family metallopeptidase [Streptomyces sp. NPDC059008]|uniref:M24 family metallopeptidase n=1 Tax=unclassified Streptomyces TaxID=2593676 RepID=UPI003694A22E
MAVPDRMDERLRTLGLVETQRMAQTLFAEVTTRGLIAPGRREREAGDRIGELAREVCGPVACPPRRVVRAGPHSVLPYGQEPPVDREIGADDIVVVDLGPLLPGYETGFARTIVLGEDPDKHRLRADLPKMFAQAREAFHVDRAVTGRQLHAEVQALAAKAGWTPAGWYAGHLAGAAPAAHAQDARADSYIGPDNALPLRRIDEGGWRAHWVLEIHLVDEHQGFGGSYKELLDLAEA